MRRFESWLEYTIFYSKRRSAVFAVCLTATMIIIANSFGALVFEDEAKITVGATLAAQGHTNIHVGEKQWFFVAFRGCYVREIAKFDVTVTAPNGEIKHLYACGGGFANDYAIRSK